MTGRDDTAITQNKYRIDWINNFGIGDRVDLVQANDLAVSTECYFRSAANDVQVSDADVVFDHDLLDTRDDVEVTDDYVVVDRALARVDDADADSDAFADPVSEEPAIERAF